MLNTALWRIPLERNNAHILSNLALAMHMAREQENVTPHVHILPGVMEIALKIYEETGAQKNHIAGCLLRATHIYMAANWLQGAETLALQAKELWGQLIKEHPDNTGFHDRYSEACALVERLQKA